MTEGIYDQEEFVKAMAWTEKYCKKNEGKDFNIPAKTKTREQKRRRLGIHCEDDYHYARPYARQSETS